MTTKLCHKCQRWLPLSAFPCQCDPGGKPYYTSPCRACKALYASGHYRRNREAYNAAARRYYERNREAVKRRVRRAKLTRAMRTGR